MNTWIIGGALVALGAGYAQVSRDVVAPITAQLYVEERDAQRALNSQAIAEVLIRRSRRAGATIAQLQSGAKVDKYTGPISAWEGFEAALSDGYAAAAADPQFRARAAGAAWRAYLAIRWGIGDQVAPGALWYRHAARAELPQRWGRTKLARVLDAPRGKVLGLYVPAPAGE